MRDPDQTESDALGAIVDELKDINYTLARISDALERIAPMEINEGDNND